MFNEIETRADKFTTKYRVIGYNDKQREEQERLYSNDGPYDW